MTDDGQQTTDKINIVAVACILLSVVRHLSSIIRLPLHPPHRRQRLGPSLPLCFEQISEQEGEVERLLDIEPRIAYRVVAVVQILVADGPRAAGAFRDV